MQLTIDEIKGMHGVPVWCHIPSDNPAWGIVDVEHECVVLSRVHALQFEYHGEWKAYREGEKRI